MINFDDVTKKTQKNINQTDYEFLIIYTKY